MRRLGRVGTLLAFCCGVSSAEVLTTFSPMGLPAARPAGRGAEHVQSGRFSSGAWLKRLSIAPIGESEKAVDLGALDYRAGFILGRPMTTAVVFSPALRLDKRISELRFPKGFGVRLPESREYVAYAELYGDPKDAGSEVSFRWESSTSAGPLKELALFSIAFVPDEHAGIRTVVLEGDTWWHPPGKGSYREGGAFAFSGSVHYAAASASAGTTRVRLVSERKTVLDLTANNGVLPSWSSASGVRVRRDVPYELIVDLENEGATARDSYAVLQLFIHPGE